MTEKRFSYELDEIFDEGNHFAYALSKENAEDIVKLLNELAEENKELKSKYSEQCTQLDFLKDENQHMRDLVNKNKQLKEKNKELQERNNRQAKQLDNIYHLIEQRDWRALSDIIDDFKKAEEQLQQEWKCYE